MNILLVGSGAREHAVARAFKKSRLVPSKIEGSNPKLFCFASNNNPGISKISDGFLVGKIDNKEEILNFAKENHVELAFIGPEAPLEAGVADLLWENDIKVVGPKKLHAQLETSKAFTRDLFDEFNISGGAKHQNFNSIQGVEEFLNKLGEEGYVVKADGLMGGKGVKVAGDHLKNINEAVEYCEELIEKKSDFIIEEKFIGQEFSLMSFCDGDSLAHMPVVQDHKRAFEGDCGPNTGGMGTYSDANHSLPFLTLDDIKQAQEINTATAKALKEKFGTGYLGVLYGGFIATETGVSLIEYNARLGDPEAMNVMAILESDFVELCLAITNSDLTQEHAKFANKATVCKYVVPEGYPDSPIKNKKIDISEVENQDQLYLASVEEKDGELYELGSRTAAVVGIADTIEEAEQAAEAEILKIKGPLFHRKDIGTKELIQKRIDMMKDLRK